MPREFVTASGTQLEFYLYKAELGTWRQPVSRILKQTPSFFEPAVSEAATRSPSPTSATATVEHYWRILPHVTRDLRQNQLVFAHLVTLRMLSLLTMLLGESRQLPQNRAYRSYYLDPADNEALLRAFGEAPQSREAIAKQQLALAKIMSERGRALCAAIGAAYPERLDQVMRARLQRDLEELGIRVP
jgi:hypothetical protein